jgi:hypothetical protein
MPIYTRFPPTTHSILLHCRLLFLNIYQGFVHMVVAHTHTDRLRVCKYSLCVRRWSKGSPIPAFFNGMGWKAEVAWRVSAPLVYVARMTRARFAEGATPSGLANPRPVRRERQDHEENRGSDQSGLSGAIPLAGIRYTNTTQSYSIQEVKIVDPPPSLPLSRGVAERRIRGWEGETNDCSPSSQFATRQFCAPFPRQSSSRYDHTPTYFYARTARA